MPRRLTVEWPDAAAPEVTLSVWNAENEVTLSLKINPATGAFFDKSLLHSAQGPLDLTEAESAFAAGGQEALFLHMEGRLDGD